MGDYFFVPPHLGGREGQNKKNLSTMLSYYYNVTVVVKIYLPV
jgi:hypothetical protein